MVTGEFRCERTSCHKRLFDVENLEISKGSIEIKCKCGQMNVLTASDLTDSRITS